MATHAGRLHGSATARPAQKVRVGGKADRRARHVFRTRRVWPATVAAVLLTAVGVLTAIEVISALAGSPVGLVPYESVGSWLRDHAWRSTGALVASGVVAFLGLVALAYGLLPGRTRLVPLHGDDPSLLIGVTRSGLKGAVESAARDVGGVDSVGAVKIGRRTVPVTVRTSLRSDDTLGERVRAAVQARLDELGPVPSRTVRVNVNRRS